MKYDKIVAISQEKSKVKAEIAKQEIQNMLDRKEKVTMAALIRKTGFSKTLFYRNIPYDIAVKDIHQATRIFYHTPLGSHLQKEPLLLIKLWKKS